MLTISKKMYGLRLAIYKNKLVPISYKKNPDYNIILANIKSLNSNEKIKKTIDIIECNNKYIYPYILNIIEDNNEILYNYETCLLVEKPELITNKICYTFDVNNNALIQINDNIVNYKTKEYKKYNKNNFK